MNVERLKLIGRVLVAVSVLTATGLSGCVIFDETTKARIDRIVEDAKATAEIGKELQGQLVDVVAAVKEGRIPVAEGSQLVATIMARQDEIEARSQRLAAEWQNAQKEGTSPWVLVGGIILQLLTGGGGLALLKKAGTLGSAFGALSRAADEVAKDRIGPAMAEEISRTPGLTTDLVKTLHHAATDRQL